MNMRNILAALILMLSSHAIVMAQKTVTIKGTIKGDLKGHTTVYVLGNEDKKDSTYVKNGSFELNIPFVKPFLPRLYTEVKGRKSYLMMVVDKPGTIYLKDVDIEIGLSSGSISGIKSATDYYQYNKNLVQLNKELEEQLRKKYGDSITRKSPNYEAYASDRDAMYNLKKANVVQRYLRENPDAYLSAYLLALNKPMMSTNELEQAYQLLSKNIRESKIGKGIEDYITGAKKSEIGNVINDFTLNDANDQPFSFSQLKGKYVVIDFWASWCGPCKASFPHMKELYKKYKGDRFEIYSISTDQSKSEWLRELKKQELPWLQALDNNKITSNGFAITGIPTTFLIDPQGKILLKEVGYVTGGSSRLEKKLVELFGDK